MAKYPKGFLFHHHGDTFTGVVLPSGRALLVDDQPFGLATVAPTLAALTKAYPGARVDWPPVGTCEASIIGALGQTLGPCVLRPHTSPVHQDATGATWWTRTDHPKGT